MVTPEERAPPLEPESAAQLADFARACKAAARAVTFYPATHPAVAASLGRLVDVVAHAGTIGRLALTVLPDTLLLEGRHSPRADPAVAELAQILHGHLIATMTVHSALEPEDWRSFFLLLGRPPAEIRLEGGIGRLWTSSGSRALELQEIDFAEVLKERDGAHGVGWEDLIRHCLQPKGPEFDEQTLGGLLEVVGSPDRLAELALTIERQSAGSGLGSQTAALLRMLNGIVGATSRTAPERLEQVLGSMASAVSGLSPSLALELLSGHGRAGAAADLVLQVANRLTDSTIADLVARAVVTEQGATGRLAQAFHALVPDGDRRGRLLQTAATHAESIAGDSETFRETWESATATLMAYSDEAFVSAAYARELSEARTQAVEVERVSDDPPERIAEWIESVNDITLRKLDLLLLLDLLRIETDPTRRREVSDSVMAQIEDLLLVGDFDSACLLAEGLTGQSRSDVESAPPALPALDRLVGGPMMGHLVAHLPTVDERGFQQIKRLCAAVGAGLIQPLAEAVAVEKRTTTRQRLTDVLLGFGAEGRQAVERLKGSPNPAVRLTAIHLLREFGGTEALSDLTLLLDDTAPQIQREALQAILLIGTEDAYAVLQKVLVSSSEQSRSAMMVALVGMHDDRAAPLFAYIMRHADHRGALAGVYLRAVEALGELRSAAAVQPLVGVLHQGEWWAPKRTAKMRRAAAMALQRIGSREALDALRDAAAGGSRGVRAVARAHLQAGT